jgi:anti-anti-sigma factor
MASVAEFGRALAEVSHESTGGVIVDLSAVAFIDSSGFRPILELHEELKRERRSLAIVAPRGTSAAQLLTLTGLRRRLRVFESRREAKRF